MHIFSRIQYHLSNQLIESPNYPGQATTMLGMLKYPDDFSKAQCLNQLWYKETATTAAKADNNGFAAWHAYLIQSPTVKGTFSFRIRLKHIFDFGEGYDKIVYGLKHSLTLVGKQMTTQFLEEQQLVLEKSVLITFHGLCLTLFPQMLKVFNLQDY